MSGLEKNVSGQKWLVRAFDLDGLPVTGGAANITAKIRKDFGSATALGDTNPTELESGFYEFDLTQAETNAKVLDLIAVSATAGVYVVGVPARIFTVPAGSATATPQTGDAYAIVSSGTHGNAALKALIDAVDDYLDTEVAAIKAKTDGLPSDPADASVVAGLIAAVQAVVDAVKLKTDNLPSDPADASSVAGLIAALEAKVDALDAVADAIKLKTDNLPSDPADASVLAGLIAAVQAVVDAIVVDTGTDIPASLATIAAYLDTEIAAIKAKTDNLPADPATETTLAALDALLDLIKAKTDNLPSDPADASVLAGLIASVQSVVDAVKLKTDGLPSDPADASVIAGLIATLQATADAILVDTGTDLPASLSTIAGYLDTEIAAIKAKTDNLPSDPADASVVAGLIAALQAVADAIKLKTDALPASPAATGDVTDAKDEILTAVGDIEGGGGAIEGAHNLVVAVTNSVGGGNLQNARVRLYLNADDETKLTGVNGQPATPFTLDDGTWNYTVKLTGFDGASGTKVIAGADSTLSVQLTPQSVPASDPGEVTVYAHALKVNDAGDGFEDAGAGVVVHLQVTDGDVPGFVIPGEVLEATTDADSKAYFTGIPWSVRFAVWEGDSVHKKKRDRTPDSGTTHPVPLIVGAE